MGQGNWRLEYACGVCGCFDSTVGKETSALCQDGEGHQMSAGNSKALTIVIIMIIIIDKVDDYIHV